MLDQFGQPIPLPLIVVGLVLAAAVAVALVVFNEKLRGIPEYVETIIHETGHSLASIPFLGGLPMRIDFYSQADAQVIYPAPPSRFGNWFTRLSGYAFTVLYGVTLVWLTFTPQIHISDPLSAVGMIYIAMMVMGRFLPAIKIVLSLALFSCLAWVLFSPPAEAPDSILSGLEAQLITLGIVVFALLAGSWRHIFSRWNRETLRTFLILSTLLGTLAVIQLIPTVAGFAIFSVGLFLIISGIKTIIIHGSDAGDYCLLSDDFGFSPKFYFVQFLILSPLALLCVLRILWVLTFP